MKKSNVIEKIVSEILKVAKNCRKLRTYDRESGTCTSGCPYFIDPSSGQSSSIKRGETCPFYPEYDQEKCKCFQMTSEEFCYVYKKWSTCGSENCFSLYSGRYKHRRRFKELTLKSDYEVRLCFSCKFWRQK